MRKVNYRLYTKLMLKPARVQKETDRVTRLVISMGRQDSAQRVQKAFTVFKQILDLAVMGERLMILVMVLTVASPRSRLVSCAPQL